MHRDNHYVPRSYLKRWTCDGLKVWVYRVLVPHPRVPLWRKSSTRGIAYHEHLYTKLAASGESDEIERWLDSEFERPAEEAIDKIVSDQRLLPSDWALLTRFVAAQDVRTPARLVENLKRWTTTLPGVIQTTLADSVSRLEAMTPEERGALSDGPSDRDELPVRITLERNSDRPGGWIKGETVLGRGLWLWSMRHVLTHTLRVLHQHRWTVLAPPDGMSWFTSDDPVLKVNFNSPTDYTFGGGWGSVGTDILLPLGPRHLLFTQVGQAVPQRGTRMDVEKATIVRRLIAEHAHRYIFADTPDPFVEQVRPRTVDAEVLKHEAHEWERWHAEQTTAEGQLMGRPNVDPPAT